MNRVDIIRQHKVKIRPVLVLSIMAFCIACFLKYFYRLPVKDSLLWYIGVFIYFYIPGDLITRYLDFNEDECLIRFFHSVALGTALMPIVYMVFRRISCPELLYPFGIAAFIFWFLLKASDIKKGRPAPRTSSREVLAAFFLTGFVFLLLHFSYFTDIVFTEAGFRIRTTYLTETVYHLGIINNLKNIFPPFYPYASGTDFSHYHLNMHLQIEMFNRLFHLDTLKLTFFYFPLLYVFLLVFVPYMYVRKYLGSRLLGIVTGILMLGSDLSFIPGLSGMTPQNYPWTLVFMTTIWSLFTLNGNLPALFIMFLSIFHLKRYYDHDTLPDLALFSLLGFSAFGFKSSMGPHIMGAAILTGILTVVLLKERKKGLFICTASLIAGLAMMVDMALRGSAGNIIINIEPFIVFNSFLKKFKLSDTPSFYYPFIFLAYFLGVFSVRFFGFTFVRDICRKSTFDPLKAFLIIFSILGFVLSEVFFIGSPSGKVNNAEWFSVESLMAAWLLLAYVIVQYRPDRQRFLVFMLISVLLAAPTTIQFLFLRFDNKYYDVNSSAMEVVRFLEKTPPKSVVLHPPNLSYPSLASNFAGRSSVLSVFCSFASEEIGAKEYAGRLNDLKLFGAGKGSDRAMVLRKHYVDYVYMPSAYAPRFDNEPILIKVLKNSKYVLYKVDFHDNSFQK